MTLSGQPFPKKLVIKIRRGFVLLNREFLFCGRIQRFCDVFSRNRVTSVISISMYYSPGSPADSAGLHLVSTLYRYTRAELNLHLYVFNLGSQNVLSRHILLVIFLFCLQGKLLWFISYHLVRNIFNAFQ